MDRITMRDLEATVSRINTITGNPQKPYARLTLAGTKHAQFVANIGCYHLSGAYGGYALEQIVTIGGGTRDIFGGHMPKRELYERMHAFIRGLESAKAAA